MLQSTKTTTVAILALITLIANTVNSLVQGLPVDWGTVIPSFVTAIGLLFAKDWNVSGTNKPQ